MMWGDRGWDPGQAGWRMHDGAGWGGWFVMMLLMVLLAVLVVALFAFVLRSGVAQPPMRRGRTGRPGPSQEARRTLDERYARGELDDEEYVHRLDVLRTKHV